MLLRKLMILPVLSLGLALAACSSDNDGNTTGDGDGDITGDGDGDGDSAPTTYEFESRFIEGESSVSYSGQMMRHLLIKDLTTFIDGLHDEIENNAEFDASTVGASLLSYYEFDSDTLGTNDILLTTDPELLQKTYDDVSTGKDLAGKIAGQDGGGEKDHKDWSSDFVGWGDTDMEAAGGDISNPDGLVRAFLATLAENAQLQADADDSRSGLEVTQTAQGQDLKQLIEKFLLGAVAFAQGSDDYLDEGLGEDNTMSDEGDAYSALEHAWDEGFGYFGASRYYLSISDDDIADGNLFDGDDDGKIDVTSEYNFGASVNAAKRDRGSQSGTDLTKEAMEAFLQGRHLIATEGNADDIAEQADIAVGAWEKAIAATAIHYVNDTLGDMGNIGTDDYSFDDHAKHWSELKGFALSFQFNPNSPVSDSDFEKLHDLIGDAPVLENAGSDALDDYEAALLEARDLMRDAYGFEDDDAENW